VDAQIDAAQCLKLAQARYDALPESDRGLAPFVALRALATTVVVLSGVYGRHLEVDAMGSLLPLLAPFRSLGALLTLLYDITSAAVERVRGRRFSDHIGPLLIRLEQPVPGLDEVTRQGARRTLTYHLALEQAQLGSPAVLVHADFIAEDPAYETLAEHVRMLKHLYSGESLQASACRERTELLALRHPDTMAQLSTSILYETEVHALSADLIALKTALPQLELLAQRSAGWQLFWQTVRGEYEMLRGQSEQACAAFEQVLSVVQPGAHTVWGRTASSYVAALVAREAHDQAIEFAERACAASALHRVNPLYGVLLRTGLARAYAERGDHASGRREIERVLNEALELGMTGLPLGYAYEAAARVALCAGEESRFEAALEQTRVHYTRGGAAPLIARFQRLTADALRRGSGSNQRAMATLVPSAVPSRVVSSSRESTHGPGQTVEERARVALSLLLDECGAAAGCLYGSSSGSLLALAGLGEFDPVASAQVARGQLDDALTPCEQTVQDSSRARTVNARPDVQVGANRALVQAVLLTALVDNRSVVTGVVTLWNAPPKLVLPWPLLHAISAALLESNDIEPVALPEA
jgi:tetratricopeptide (TPR) repeat protein